MNTNEATVDTMEQVAELARGMGEAAAAVDPGFRYTVRAGDLAKVCGAFGRARDNEQRMRNAVELLEGAWERVGTETLRALGRSAEPQPVQPVVAELIGRYETQRDELQALSANARMCELLLGKALNGDDAPHPEPGTLQQLTRGVIDGLRFAMNEGKAILKDAEGVLWALGQVRQHPSFGWLVKEIATPIALQRAGRAKDASPDAAQNAEVLRLLLAVMLGGQVDVAVVGKRPAAASVGGDG